jgi:hypothetical protein
MAVVQQAQGQVLADEAGRAGDEETHVNRFVTRSAGGRAARHTRRRTTVALLLNRTPGGALARRAAAAREGAGP